MRESVKRNLYTGRTYNSVENIAQFFAERGMPPPSGFTRRPPAQNANPNGAGPSSPAQPPDQRLHRSVYAVRAEFSFQASASRQPVSAPEPSFNIRNMDAAPCFAAKATARMRN